jgi:hypothetical protein
MHIAVTDDRFAMPPGPRLGARIEVETANEHRVALDSIEEIGMAFEVATQARACRKERMRRDHQSPFARAESPEIVEAADGLRRTTEVQQQHVPAAYGALDTGNERHAPLGRV